MKIGCKMCGKLVDLLDIDKENGAYYNLKKEIVCYKCFFKELEKEGVDK